MKYVALLFLLTGCASFNADRRPSCEPEKKQVVKKQVAQVIDEASALEFMLHEASDYTAEVKKYKLDGDEYTQSRTIHPKQWDKRGWYIIPLETVFFHKNKRNYDGSIKEACRIEGQSFISENINGEVKILTGKWFELTRTTCNYSDLSK